MEIRLELTKVNDLLSINMPPRSPSQAGLNLFLFTPVISHNRVKTCLKKNLIITHFLILFFLVKKSVAPNSINVINIIIFNFRDLIMQEKGLTCMRVDLFDFGG